MLELKAAPSYQAPSQPSLKIVLENVLENGSFLELFIDGGQGLSFLSCRWEILCRLHNAKEHPRTSSLLKARCIHNKHVHLRLHVVIIIQHVQSVTCIKSWDYLVLFGHYLSSNIIEKYIYKIFHVLDFKHIKLLLVHLLTQKILLVSFL